MWRREWVFLWEKLKTSDSEHAANIRRKLRGGHSYDTHIQITNKLYISKPEQPWLVEWIKQQAQNGIEQEYFD